MAVVEQRQRQGIGRALVERAIGHCRAEGEHTLLRRHGGGGHRQPALLPAAGFRDAEVERNAFTADDGYPTSIVIDGIPLRDRVWLTWTCHEHLVERQHARPVHRR